MSTIVPLLMFANKYDLIGVLESSSDEILPIVGAVIDKLTVLLPTAQYALSLSPTFLAGIAVASAAGSVALTTAIPDDSVFFVALQTALVVPFGLVLPGVAGGASIFLSKYGNN